MIPVFQSITDPITGDCMSACLASILEVDPRTIPKFLEWDQGNFWKNVQLWCQSAHNKMFVGQGGFVKFSGYSILGYEGHRYPHTGQRVVHAIVAKDGEPVHCPITGRGFTKWWWVRPDRITTSCILIDEAIDYHLRKMTA